MSKIVYIEDFERSDYYDDEGNVLFDKNMEYLLEGSEGAKRTETEDAMGEVVRILFTPAVFQGNLWEDHTRDWPWSHANEARDVLQIWWQEARENRTPQEYFANEYNFYAKSWVWNCPPEVYIFLLSKPFRLVPSLDGRPGMHAVVKIADDVETGQKISEAIDTTWEMYQKMHKASKKLQIHGYDDGPRDPRTMMAEAAVRSQEKLEKIKSEFRSIRWLEYNMRFRNTMEEWEEIFSGHMYGDLPAETCGHFAKLAKLLGLKKVENEEEED